jgi:hypothetical protein
VEVPLTTAAAFLLLTLPVRVAVVKAVVMAVVAVEPSPLPKSMVAVVMAEKKFLGRALEF